MLSKRAMMYVNRKVRKLDSELKEELLSVAKIPDKQIPTTTINGKIISNREMYSKPFFYYFVLKLLY